MRCLISQFLITCSAVKNWRNNFGYCCVAERFYHPYSDHDRVQNVFCTSDFSYVGVGDGNFVGSGLFVWVGRYFCLKSRFAMFLIVVFS